MQFETIDRGSLGDSLRRCVVEDGPRLFLLSVVVGLFFLLYHHLGNPVDSTGATSTVIWVWDRWRSTDRVCGRVYRDFGLLIPLTSIVLIWLKRRDLREIAGSARWPGMACIALGLFLHWVGVKTQHPRLSIISFVVLLYGSVWFLQGGVAVRKLAFPIGFLFLIIPLNFLNGAVILFRSVVAGMAAALLRGLGLDCRSRGTTILGAPDAPFLFELPSNPAVFQDLLILVMVGSVVAYLSQATTLRRCLVFAMLFPVYVFCLSAMVVMLTLMTQIFGDAVRDVISDGILSVIVLVLVTLMCLGLVHGAAAWGASPLTPPPRVNG